MYGKLKHGLIFHSGAYFDQNIAKFFNWKNSSIIAYGRKNEQDLTSDHFTANRNETMIPYYNIINIVKFNDNFLKDIASVISILDTLIHYMCRNHKIYGWNCGETYFPYEKKGNAIYSKLPGWQSNRSEVDKLILQNILSEIGQFMNINERRSTKFHRFQR